MVILRVCIVVLGKVSFHFLCMWRHVLHACIDFLGPVCYFCNVKERERWRKREVGEIRWALTIGRELIAMSNDKMREIDRKKRGKILKRDRDSEQMLPSRTRTKDWPATSCAHSNAPRNLSRAHRVRTRDVDAKRDE